MFCWKFQKQEMGKQFEFDLEVLFTRIRLEIDRAAWEVEASEIECWYSNKLSERNLNHRGRNDYHQISYQRKY